ncbi:MAG: hypothetical protein ACRD4P_13875 [Bryobacteraceae bacterium]
MARGWESKAVESQIELARERGARARQRLTPEEAAAEAKRDSLLLQRTRVLRDFQNCGDARYRKTLSEGLAYLESQLTGLGWRPE